MQYPQLEDKIFFTKDKHDKAFGTAFLKTKLKAESEINRSVFINPDELRTDDYEWNTKSYVDDINLKAVNLLTLPKLYNDLHPNYVEASHSYNVKPKAKAVLAKVSEPFENRRKKLLMYSSNLKLTNNYLSDQKQKYNNAKYNESELLLESERNSVIPIDYNFHVDDSLLKSSVFTGNNTDFRETSIIEVEEGSSEEETDEEDSKGDIQKKDNRPFFVDTYTDESVLRLLSNIEALNLDPSQSFNADSLIDDAATSIDELQQQQQQQQQFAAEAAAGKETAKKQAFRPSSRGKHLKYDPHDPLYQPPSKTENLLQLTNDTQFDLSSQKQISLGQMDKCIFRNSRRFGTRFDEKVQRKKTIVQIEKRSMRKAMQQAQRNVITAVKANHSPLHSAMRDIVSAAANQQTAGGGLTFADAVLSKMRRNGPLAPIVHITSSLSTDLHSRHNNTIPFSAPPDSGKLSLKKTDAIVNSTAATVSRLDYQFADHVRPKSAKEPTHLRNPFDKPDKLEKVQTLSETKRLLRATDDNVDADNGAESTGGAVELVTLSDMNEQLHEEIFNQGDPSILFDLNRHGKIVEVVLRSEQPVERPRSANKAVHGLNDQPVSEASLQKTHKSMQTLLTRRRKYVKPPKKRRNLDTIVPISKEDADIERRALISIYEMCGGRDWINNSNWCSDVPVKEWWGVGVTVEGYVFEVDLADNNLRGTFPDSLALLSRLEVVLLDRNYLRGDLPDYCLSKLSKLQVLSAQFNYLSGHIPFNMMTNMRCLTDIWLANNQLSGSIQEGISQLTNLINLNLFHNKLSGPIPAGICKLHRLEFLNFGNNGLTGPIPHEIISLHKLRTIALYNNKLSGEVPPWLETIPYLEELEIFNNQFSGYVPNCVADLHVYKRGRL